jgi:hypothetical protein
MNAKKTSQNGSELRQYFSTLQMKGFTALVIWHHYYIDNTSEIRTSQKWYKTIDMRIRKGIETVELQKQKNFNDIWTPVF